MTKLLVVTLSLFSVFARADGGVAPSVNAWIAQQAKTAADSLQGIDGEASWQVGSDGLIYAGTFTTKSQGRCTVSAFRSEQTADRLEYEMLLRCQIGQDPAGNLFLKSTRTFQL